MVFEFSLLTAWGIPMCGSHTVMVLENAYLIFWSLIEDFLYYSYYVVQDNQLLERITEGPPESSNRGIFLCSLQCLSCIIPHFPITVLSAALEKGLEPPGQSPIISLTNELLFYSNRSFQSLIQHL